MFRSVVSIGVVVLAAGLAAVGGSSAKAQDAETVDFATVEFEGWSRWDGFYAGGLIGNAGGGFDDGDGSADGRFEGWMAGLAAGYDLKLEGGMIAGVVADAAWADIAATDELGEDAGTIDWNGSLRGRVGFDAENLLPYLTAGLAYGSGTVADVSSMHWGWTAGIGVEVAFDDKLSIDTEWRYTDLGDTPDGSDDLAWSYQQFTVGLNWGF